ncbi:MAG: hypothetical protein ABDI19_00710 [Armatimonadota bacterium]
MPQSGGGQESGSATKSELSDALFQPILAQANLRPEEVRFDPDLFEYFFNTQYATPFFRMCLREPLRLPYHAERLRNMLATAVARPALAVELGGNLLGAGTRRTLLSDPLESLRQQSQQSNALAQAIQAVYREANTPIPTPVRQQLEGLNQVPPIVQQQAAFLIYTALHARRWRDTALKEVEDLNGLFRLLTLPIAEAERELESGRPDGGNRVLERALQRVDMQRLLAGGHDCLLAGQQVMEAFQKLDSATRDALRQPFEFTVDTPWGRVRLCGGGNDTHPRLPYLLIIDTGGNDTYYGGGATLSVANAISWLIDLEGNDQYGADAQSLKTPIPEQPNRAKAGDMAFGGAALGYAFVFDLAGDDLYRTASAGLGATRFGVGALIDLQGNDLYDGYAFAQGAGVAGVGLLIDRGGQDRYQLFQGGQGYGGVRGAGFLVDVVGNDQYIAHDQPLDFPSAQTKERNTSLAQGCGIGRRADYSDGHSFAGGIGLLLDVQGDDLYRCGVFGQGTGYWGGTGWLIDLQGNDTREGAWYVQGAAAHFAIGYLEDRLGNDRYLAAFNMAMGAGHDFSIGYLYEASGDDQYDAPSLALGGGNANGIGIFVDLQGDDQYRVRANSANLGRVNPFGRGTLRERALCLGLFLDGDGTDSYPPMLDFAGNARNWITWGIRNERPQESQLGVGSDR